MRVFLREPRINILKSVGMMAVDQEIGTGLFELIGEDITRKDLAVRRETKFILPNADVVSSGG